MRRLPRCARALALPAALLFASPALVARADRDRVVVVEVPPEESGWPEAERRIAAELAAMELKVAIGVAGIPDPLEDPEVLGSLRLVRMVERDPDRTERVSVTVALWDGPTGQPRLHQVLIGGRGQSLSAGRAGLLVAEFLYALMQGTGSVGTAPRPAAHARALAPPLAPDPMRGWSLGAAALLALAPADLGARPGLGLAVGVPVSTIGPFDLSVGAAATVVFPPATVAGQAGMARLAWALPRAHVEIGSRWRRVVPSLRLGVGALIARATAAPQPPFEGRTDLANVAVVSGEAAVALPVTARWRLRVGATTAVLLPALEVRLGGDDVARVGRPLVEFAVGFERLLGAARPGAALPGAN